MRNQRYGTVRTFVELNADSYLRIGSKPDNYKS